MNPPIVTVTSVSKTFKVGRERVHALKNMSLSIDQGEVFALLGPNGSGKTTTLNILSGLLDPDQGSVKILGRSPGDRDYFKGVSFMAGDAEFFWAFTVTEIL